MLSAPDRTIAFESHKTLYRAIEETIEAARRRVSWQLFSISFDISPVDPLGVFDALTVADGRNFYFEKPDRGEAIVAWDVAATQPVTGRRRFQEAQAFVDRCRGRSHHFGIAIGDRGFCGPTFICNFPFLDSPQGDGPFSQGTVTVPRWCYGHRPDGKGHLRGIFTATRRVDHRTVPGPLCDEILQQVRWLRSGLPLGAPGRADHPRMVAKTAVRSVAPAPLEVPLEAPLEVPLDLMGGEMGDGFEASVAAAIEDIQRQRLRKVVLAHALDLDLDRARHLGLGPTLGRPVALLGNLRDRYPNCYSFALGDGQGRTFLGASPERLVRLEQTGPGGPRLYTEALAGSAPRGTTPQEDRAIGDRLLRSPKELYEHALVADFIVGCLQDLGATVERPAHPQLHKLANIQHLHAPIAGHLKHPLDPLAAVAALHPTPAVAGTPRNAAIAAIARYEAFDRGPYAAPLGWIDSQGNAEFAVGIRCALLDGDRARLYGGAGIVAGSTPQRERAEIQLKLQALLAALV
jgi:menaquinone-specific isochorismate synthase